jgi:hypothetical protein
MLRFNRSKQPRVPNYFSRREQWRLLLLVMSLGVVIIAMRTVRQPESIERVARAFSSEPASATGMTMPGPEAGPRAVDPGDQRWPGEEPPNPHFEQDLLEVITDNTYFRNSEKDAWFRFFDFLQGTTLEQVEAASGTEANYVQLVDQPDAYRGRFVTVRGWVRQVTRQKPASNDLGIEMYYRVVVQPSDGVNWPIFVYSLALPPELREGDDVAGSLKVTGLYFKNLSYQWQDGVGIAPVIVAKSVQYVGAAPPGSTIDARQPIAADDWSRGPPQAAVRAQRGPVESPPFREILALAGWDVTRLAAFDDGKTLSDVQRLQALRLLRRLRSFDAASFEKWVHEGLEPHSVVTSPEQHRGQLVRVAGRVTKVSKHLLESADAARLEMPEYFECELVLDEAGRATVLTTRVPLAWVTEEILDEPTSAVALYFKRLSNAEPPQAIWLAKELAWHPTVPDEPRVLVGKSILGSLGMDVGLLDGIRSRGSIRSTEREAFYQMLGAVSGIGAHQLARLAQGNIDRQRERWVRESAHATDKAQRALANEVVRRADEGRYSVAPLFNEPQQNIGQLFVFDGVARRALRVEVGRRPDGGPGDVADRFGFDHYYEIQVFTDDSQNYPLVFCVRELPTGFATGGNLHVPVRVAGFFFKDWLYTTRGAMGADTGGEEALGPRSQFAPLLVGRSPLVLEVGEDGSSLGRMLGGSLFLLGLAGFGAIAWWFARDDRKFTQRRRNASLDTGQSLKELNLDVAIGPITVSGTPKHNASSALD